VNFGRRNRVLVFPSLIHLLAEDRLSPGGNIVPVACKALMDGIIKILSGNGKYLI